MSGEDSSSVGRALDGRYRIGAEIGAGGLGAVYRATHELLDKPVAIKLLHERYGENPLLRARFEREAKALATLDHPSIVAVTDYGVADKTPYLVMELLEGKTLADRLAEGPIDTLLASSLASDLLRALAFVHGRGLVHRDVKPGNVFLQRTVEGTERLKLLDFGLAKFTERPSGSADATLTRAGDMLGTPAYMPPEQVGGDDADARSDVYAAGVVLFQMLTGRLPFEGEAVDQLRGHLAEPVPKLADVSPELLLRTELDSILQRAMAKRREERFVDAEDMLRALEAVPQPWAARGSRQAAHVDDAVSTANTLVVPGVPGAASVEAVARRRRAPHVMITLACIAAVAAGLTMQREPPADVNPGRKQQTPQTQTHAAPAITTAVGVLAVPPPPVTANPPKPLPPAKNPWVRPVPKTLRPLRKSLARGEVGNERTVSVLRRYNQAHDDDVRGHLLLGRLYMNREWRNDALNQFSLTVQIDPAARGAPELLPALLRLVGQGAVSADASTLVASAYGAEALPAIDRALLQAKADPQAVQRLSELRARVTAR